jgi:hypothetical protein
MLKFTLYYTKLKLYKCDYNGIEHQLIWRSEYNEALMFTVIIEYSFKIFGTSRILSD